MTWMAMWTAEPRWQNHANVAIMSVVILFMHFIIAYDNCVVYDEYELL